MPVGVGHEEPVVSVIVTQVGDPEALVVVSQARTLMEELTIDATAKTRGEKCIFDDAAVVTSVV